MDPRGDFSNHMSPNSSPHSENINIPASQYPQGYSPPQYAMHLPPSHYPHHSSPSHYPQHSPPSHYFQNLNPYGSPSNFQHQGLRTGSFQGIQQQAFANSPSGILRAAGIRASSHLPPVPPCIGSFATTSSNGPDSVPSDPTHEDQPTQQVESDGSSPEEDGRRGVRCNWDDEENVRLVSSWLANSNDPVDGNAKKSEFYWRSVTEEFNKNRPKNGRTRTAKQCKSHWSTLNKAIASFNGVYERAKSAYSSGQCDSMLKSKTREWYKAENNQKAFTMEYLWDLVKDQPKWRKIYVKEDKSKRTKISESGAYTSSSNQEGEDVGLTREQRPEGQKAAKARRKAKSVINEPCENMRLYHDAMSKKAGGNIAIAEATNERTKLNKGELNDINVLNQSPLFTEVLQGRAPAVQFHVNGTEYNMGYYLADGIYPEWATFVKSIPLPQNEKDKLYAKRQESCRKDVECTFGVLQKRWAIIRTPARLWQRENLADIMYGCVILHNMIIEDERYSDDINQDHTYDQRSSSLEIPAFSHGPIHGFARLLELNTAIHDRPMHRQLKADLVEHIWQRFEEDQD